MTLWLILAATSLYSIMSMVLAAANREYVAALKELKKTMKPRATVVATSLMLLLAYSVGGLWTWYSVQSGDWRFAAIAWTPSAAQLLFRIINPEGRA